MTSEVVLMNRQAVALAADSATTFSYWENGERRTQYFKGTNKIFNLLYNYPVALMIYGSANLESVPWELIIKAYRNNGSYKDFLNEHAEDLYNFIEKNSDLYSPQLLEEKLFLKVLNSLIAIVKSINKEISYEIEESQKRELFRQKFNELTTKIKSDQFIGFLTHEIFIQLLSQYGKKFFNSFKEIKMTIYLGDINLEKLIELAFLKLLKKQHSTLETSGLIITGFGKRDYFPILKNYICYGFIGDRLICEEVEEIKISQDNTSDILPVAQCTMAKTFMYGMSDEAWTNAEIGIQKVLKKFSDYIIENKANSLSTVNLKEKEKKLKEEFLDELLGKIMESQVNPMKRVLTILPLGELAELAEMLVRMESLKERVTRNSEAVSGPIDVAVISKGDGFIWIKRKHYFDPNLNPRFFKKRESNAE